MRYGILTLLAVLFSCISASAQYNEARFPQDTAEIALFKKLKVHQQLKLYPNNGQIQLWEGRAFDEEGRLIGHIDQKHRRYYIYDEQSRVISILDSAYEKGGFKAKEYKFTYDPSGRLTAMDHPEAKSVIEPTPDPNTFREIRKAGDTTWYTLYRFDNTGNLIETAYFDRYEKLAGRHIWNYTTATMLLNEFEISYREDGKDSIITVYQYWDPLHIAGKQVFSFHTWLLTPEGGTKPTQQAQQYFVETYKYTYDDQRRLVSEKYEHDKNPAVGHYYTWTYDKNGLISEQSYKMGLMDPFIINYKYIFYNE